MNAIVRDAVSGGGLLRETPAHAAARIAFASIPDPHGNLGGIFEHLGDAYLANGKKELAVDAWQKALKLANASEEENRIKTKLGSNANR